MTNNIGIIVGRFQVNKLHPGHLDLINSVTANHQRVAIFLGTTEAMSTKNNPLDFLTRKLMIQEHFPEVAILAIPDTSDDGEWSKELDKRIKEVFPVGKPLLYGSRDSFVKYYSGQFMTKELPPHQSISGTEQRKKISNEILSSADFRAGVIFGLANQYDKVHPTIDVAIFYKQEGKNELLLGRKNKESLFRFIGGFVDPLQDTCLEDAAIREAKEETGLDIQKVHYVCSAKVDDWRYRKEQDKIITTLFKAEITQKTGKAQDDIAEIGWFNFDELTEQDLVAEHRILFQKLKLSTL